MSKMSNLMPYDFMVKHTPQEAWIRGKGLLLWLAFFFSEIGAGIYFVSLFLKLQGGCLLGWLVALVLGGGLHMLYLGRPSRGILMLLKPATSELSRGLWVTLLFGIIGLFQVAPVVSPALPWTGTGIALTGIMGLLCVLMMSHGFLTMSGIRALPFWNSPVLLPLSVVSGIWVGSQFTALLSVLTGHGVYGAEIWARWSLFAFMAFLSVFLLGATHANRTARFSVMHILTQGTRAAFYIGVVAMGVIIPFVITLLLWGTGQEAAHPSTWILALRWFCVLIGDLWMRYVIMKSAHYAPLI